MAIYSYSKLEVFRNCPEGYKYFTIDGMIPMGRVSALDTRGLDSILLDNRWEAELEEKLLRFVIPSEQWRITVSRLKEGDFD